MIVFFDIDGTLLPEGVPGIPEETMAAIHEAQARGHLCLINTGRTMANIDAYLRKAGFDGIISGCGSSGEFCGQPLWRWPANPTATAQVIANARACGIEPFYEGHHQLAYDATLPRSDLMRRFHANVRRRGKIVRPLGETDNFPIQKFSVYTASGGEVDRFRAMTTGYVCMNLNEAWEEYAPVGVTKGTGLLRMLEFLRLPLSETIAVGDSPNDLPMLTVCPNSVAMGNGTAKNFPVSFVTLTCQDGGIPHMLRHFGLIG